MGSSGTGPFGGFLIVNDVQNGFLNENTEHIPGAVLSFVEKEGAAFDGVIATRLTGDPADWPRDRARMAGAVRTLSTPFEGELVHSFSPSETVVEHSSFTDVTPLTAAMNGCGRACICGLESDSVMVMALALGDAGVDVSIIYDLTAMTLGTASQMMMLSVMRHLLGRDHVVEWGRMP